jgi:hypothetical protein
MSPEERTLVGCGTDVQGDPKMRDSKGFVKHQMRSMNTESVIYTNKLLVIQQPSIQNSYATGKNFQSFLKHKVATHICSLPHGSFPSHH